MIALLMMAGGFGLFLVLGIVLFFVWRSKKGGNSASVGDTQDPLSDQVPVVLATVKGEKVTDVLGSSYFSSVYPGVKVSRNKTDLTSTQPTFVLSTDSKGTVTGVTANNVPWGS